MPREVGNELLGRNAYGKASNSFKIGGKLMYIVSLRKQKAVLLEI